MGCCSLLIFNKSDGFDCIQNYLIALATATLCPDPPHVIYAFICLILSKHTELYSKSGERSIGEGKAYSWKAVRGVNNHVEPE